jgi:hypothetical protein
VSCETDRICFFVSADGFKFFIVRVIRFVLHFYCPRVNLSNALRVTLYPHIYNDFSCLSNWETRYTHLYTVLLVILEAESNRTLQELGLVWP